jgi:hypothetical protein
MPSSPSRRVISAATLGLLLISPWCAAAPGSVARTHRLDAAPVPLVAQIPTARVWLSALWAAMGWPGFSAVPMSTSRRFGVRLNAGCVIDPSGAACPPTLRRDAGLIIDPSGSPCAPDRRLDEGCTIDPSGTHCVPGPH